MRNTVKEKCLCVTKGHRQSFNSIICLWRKPGRQTYTFSALSCFIQKLKREATSSNFCFLSNSNSSLVILNWERERERERERKRELRERGKVHFQIFFLSFWKNNNNNFVIRRKREEERSLHKKFARKSGLNNVIRTNSEEKSLLKQKRITSLVFTRP